MNQDNGVNNQTTFGVMKQRWKSLSVIKAITDCMRNGFDDGVWVSLIKKQVLENPGQYVIPDVRFENEIKMIRDIGGEIWWTKRGDNPEWWSKAVLDTQTGSNFMADEDIHPSEWKWANTNDKFDEIIYNESTLVELRHQVLGRLGAIPF